MCLYEREILNYKYQPNKKNKGNTPPILDYRQNSIKIGCGWCVECRKKLANEWRIRLYEEIKANKNCYFVTLSFSPAAIKKLENEMYEKEWHGLKQANSKKNTDVNQLAAYAIRMWTERWRKKEKKAPRHWLITELGHKNSERLHLHGLIWGKKENIENTWQYGNVYCGEYVNEKTINYIVKYVTKIDEYHKDYHQKILCSKGIGKQYIEINKYRHEFKGINTNIQYRTHNGILLGLPRYYKEKLWTDEEREQIWTNQLDKEEIYIDGTKFKNYDKINVEEFDKTLKGARERNKKTGYGNNLSGNKKYIITEIMKMEKNEIINYNKEKLVKYTKRREIDKIKEAEESKRIDKTKNKKDIYYYKYVGDTTKAERDYNELLEDAKTLGISVRKLRLIKDGIVTFNSQVSTNKQIELGNMLITLLKNKYKK